MLGDKQGGWWEFCRWGVVQIFRLNIVPVSLCNGASKQRILEYYGLNFLLLSEPASGKKIVMQSTM